MPCAPAMPAAGLLYNTSPDAQREPRITSAAAFLMMLHYGSARHDVAVRRRPNAIIYLTQLHARNCHFTRCRAAKRRLQVIMT